MREYTIPNILRVAKSSDKDRLRRRTGYSNYKLLKARFNNEDLELLFSVGDYHTVIILVGYLMHYNSTITKYGKVKSLESALDWCLLNGDIKVDCNCPDMRYRYAYVATKMNYKAGLPETRPASKTNPNDKGRVCKHVLAILMRPSNYRSKLSGWLYRKLVKENQL